MKVDWTQPWFAQVRDVGELVAQRIADGMSVADALNLPHFPQAPRRFVAHAALPQGLAYESFIAYSGCVLTRENLHDFFNGLVWHTQPQLKSRLNALQAQSIAAEGVRAKRGALRDALTLFDEFGALLDAPAPLLDALRARDWTALFITRRALWAHSRLVIVGHALLEQLRVAPRKGLTAHVYLGDALAATAQEWQAKPFCPLPVMGVPQWWAGNADTSFYDDAQVFRAPRTRSREQPDAHA